MNLFYDVTRGTDREIVGFKGGMPMEKDGFNNPFFPLQHIYQSYKGQKIILTKAITDYLLQIGLSELCLT